MEQRVCEILAGFTVQHIRIRLDADLKRHRTYQRIHTFGVLFCCLLFNLTQCSCPINAACKQSPRQACADLQPSIFSNADDGGTFPQRILDLSKNLDTSGRKNNIDKWRGPVCSPKYILVLVLSAETETILQGIVLICPVHAGNTKLINYWAPRSFTCCRSQQASLAKTSRWRLVCVDCDGSVSNECRSVSHGLRARGSNRIPLASLKYFTFCFHNKKRTAVPGVQQILQFCFSRLDIPRYWSRSASWRKITLTIKHSAFVAVDHDISSTKPWCTAQSKDNRNYGRRWNTDSNSSRIGWFTHCSVLNRYRK